MSPAEATRTYRYFKQPVGLYALLCALLWIWAPWATAAAEGDVELAIQDPVASGRYLLPVPERQIPSHAQFKLFLGEQPVEAQTRVLMRWPHRDETGGSESDYIRLLEIQFSGPPPVADAGYRLRWKTGPGGSGDQVPPATELPRSAAGLMDTNQQWLTQSLLLHPKDSGRFADWYLGPQHKYGLYIIDLPQLSNQKYPLTQPSQWLYDRPRALYQLFLMGRDPAWKTQADFMSGYYQEQIDPSGFFAYKPRDIKYLNGHGLLYRFMLNADPDTHETLERMFKASLNWDPVYHLERGFWTERHQAAAFNTALAYWELTQAAEARQRLQEILDATYRLTVTPVSGWPARNCPQHGLRAHEGKGDLSPVCSPWMMALLADGLWRYHRLSGDQRAAELVMRFGDFMLEHGVYDGYRKLAGTTLPHYLVAFDAPDAIEQNQWNDIRHSCDIAGLLGKAAYLKQQHQQPGLSLEELFDLFAQRCRKTHRKSDKIAQPPIKPPRRFGWEYSTSSELPWLVEELLDWSSLVRIQR